MHTNVSFNVILDERHQKKNGLYPVKLRLIENRKSKYYKMGVDLSSEDFKAVFSEKTLRGTLGKIQRELIEFREKGEKIIQASKKFNLQKFENDLFGIYSAPDDFDQLFISYINDLKKDRRESTASSYQCAYNSLKSFQEDILFETITPGWLEKYERWMRDNENSSTTVGIYVRSLRAIINLAIEKKLMDRDDYPFGRRKYIIPGGKNIKKALKRDELKMIIDYTPESVNEEKYRDYWLFLYLCNGVNVKDMIMLKYKNIDHESITFIREKTKRTSKQNQKIIEVVLLPMMNEIIKKWGAKPISPEEYVFPLLRKNMSGKDQFAAKKQAVKMINTYMKQIGEKISLKTKITTYTARHTFASLLKHNGAPISFISESLGQASVKTTERYLDSFSIDEKKKWADKLLEF